MSDPYREGADTPATPVSVLHRNLAELITESQALRGDVRKNEQASRRRTAVSLGLMGALGILVGLLVVLAWKTNQLSNQETELLRKADQTNAIMAGCTTPGGECYRENQERVATVLADVIRAEIFMAQCARLFPDEAGPAYDRKLEDCVYGRLAKAAAERKDKAQASPTPSPAPNRGG